MLAGVAGVPLEILMAEDNPTNQLITRRMLEGFGYKVEAVSDGAQAVRAAGTRRFDVILMDVFMPELDGVAAARAIRAAGPGSDVPILAVSGNADESTRIDCAAAGMNGFLPKPFSRAVLHAAIREVLGPPPTDLSPAGPSPTGPSAVGPSPTGPSLPA
ncbi:MAG: hypothetical protein BGO51_19825 [Rhodospirillales bacterium 69-11]|nr:MAG: hypothetical protein BGO51_19825 [Rhodospirillales bacterium 69-11]